ncbi:sugar phosphate nucleotidyltransferase [Caulobacter hibisci]|uniref:NTP transferase domain-containing protein n=1 Tax=Caulobacter hibisci TaxID=2035993 RepID=A0ABS0STV1_9CAUL|nr:sugar phosphate nucleotidyltransferase [Caulobacter hibisci]MBI1682814.1 NTP transferase domain-containing protein [Caulobacter hibisci]
MRQVVVLAGGLGTRLGALTAAMPKPLMPVAGRPFLEHLLEKAHRHGFDRVLLLAGHLHERIEAWLAESRIAERLGLEVAINVEPAPLGTGGALVHALPVLDEAFLLVNGDTWFDFDWRALAQIEAHPFVVALRTVPHADRYERAVLEGGRIETFLPRDAAGAGPALINGGAYRIQRETIPDWPGAWSLEQRLLPDLVEQARLGGAVFEGTFIDIGLPEALDAAQALLARP